MIKTIHYSCGCIVAFEEEFGGKVVCCNERPVELCAQHNLGVGYEV